ncbi:MAG: phosphoenolpyruvate synthase, partial [Candidatus Thermoplasmatota archaeon]|nr:phosphoenolpyruvate synthase [Candidatus Thermoplasmatota archaeon]
GNEFAVDMQNTPPTFAMLQIRPMVINKETSRITWSQEEEKSDNVFILSNNSLGNGVIENVSDIVYVKKNEFSSLKTFEISKEIEQINNILAKDGRRYVLIGPGRWGTQDRFLGIPVNWPQISNVRVLIEVALKGFNIRPTQGTHFLQNLISRDIGYASVSLSEQEYVDWNFLNSIDASHDLKFVTHSRLKHPLTIKLDGKRGRMLIVKN